MLSRSHAAPPCHAKRYTRFVGPPLAHTVSRQSRPVRARPSQAAGSGTRHTTRARTGSMRIRLLSPYPSLVTITEPSESVTRFKGSVPTGTARPAARIRQPLGRSVDPSGNEPGTRRVARSAAPAMAGSASRERLSMSRNMAARGTAGIPLALGAMTGLIFHLIPHTHWDREWYLPRAALRARLVAGVDALTERLQADPGYRSFLLDGQTVLLEDYLRARPDREGDVRALVKTGRLQVGPWYVLPDEQIPSGEGLVRNLLLGSADADRLGGRLDVLYSPDAFGHPPAWPTLAREFGIRYGVVWRGLGGEAGQERDLYRWRGLDGKEVVLWHLPRAGYEIGAALPANAERLFAAWAPVRGLLVQRATGKHIPVFIGADHHAAHPDVPRLRDLLAELDPQSAFRVSRLDEFFQAAADGAKPAPLAGELRWSYRYAWTLQGVHGTRAPLKRRYSAAGLALRRLAEPLAALARRAGGPARRPAPQRARAGGGGAAGGAGAARGAGLPAVRACDLGRPHGSRAAARPARRDRAARCGASLSRPGRGRRGAHRVSGADRAGPGVGERRPDARCDGGGRCSYAGGRRVRKGALAHQPLDRSRARAHRGPGVARPSLGTAFCRSTPHRRRRRRR